MEKSDIQHNKWYGYHPPDTEGEITGSCMVKIPNRRTMVCSFAVTAYGKVYENQPINISYLGEELMASTVDRLKINAININNI